MIFGHTAPNKLPKQDAEKVMKLVDQFERASTAHRIWAEPAKKCVDYFEGRQWTADEIAQRFAKGLPSLSFNEIGPLVRLVIGYFQNNKTDLSFMPGNDAHSTQDLAELLSQVIKQISTATQLAYVDTETYLDGLLTGRGFQETKLNFEENMLGEVETKAVDPFTVYLDPESHEYDLNDHPRVQMTRWVSLDEIEATYGRPAKGLLEGFTNGNVWNGFPISAGSSEEEVSPIRNFGQQLDEYGQDDYSSFRSTFFEHLYDTSRKTVRILDTQYWVRQVKPCFIDLETGDKAVIPDSWDNLRVAKVLEWAARSGNPLKVQRLMCKRARWTVLAGDVIVHDSWSLYDRFTLSGFFPYIRRGITKGMVEDLIDPQDEINKRRNLEIEIVGRQAKGGWVYEEGTFDAKEEENFKTFGSTPGARVKTRTGKKDTLKELGTGPAPQAMEKLEQKGYENVRRTAGINESALGNIDKVQSGKAILARQQQAVVGLQMYQTNWKRSKELQGRAMLEIIQKYYVETRVFRILGEDGKLVEKIINDRRLGDDGVMQKFNDVTVGKYLVKVDETPMSATFQSAQFEEFTQFFEKFAPALGQAAPLLADIWIDMSSMPRKDEVKRRVKAILGIEQLEASTAMASGNVPMPQGQQVPDQTMPIAG
ncbi:hypothetical protein [Terasakiella pusilla]|uniref:portal protein n=1 Tax=Terasakiella pusilla TaxID=64973 RepID=UPI003AA96889